MRRHEPAQPEEGEVGGAGGRHPVEIGGKGRVGRLGREDFLGVRRGLPQNQPGHGTVVRAGRADHGPVRVDRPVTHLLHPRVDLHQRLRHVGADGELQFDRAERVARIARQLHEPFHAPQLFFEGLHEFTLDLLRTGTHPAGADRDGRSLHLRRELHRHREQGQHAKQRHQDHAHGDLHGIGDTGRNEIHRGLAKTMAEERRRGDSGTVVSAGGYGCGKVTAMPGRSRSLPRMTTSCPGSRPPRTSTLPSIVAPSDTCTGRTVPVVAAPAGVAPAASIT